MQPPIIYQDGIRIIAVGENYSTIRYGISRNLDSTTSQLVLSQEEARELVGALTWIISEVDAKNGRQSFKPQTDWRRMRREQKNNG